MARFKLKQGKTDEEFGDAIVAAATAYLQAGRQRDASVLAEEQKVKDLIDAAANDAFEFHYDGLASPAGANTFHIAIPDLSATLAANFAIELENKINQVLNPGAAPLVPGTLDKKALALMFMIGCAR